MQTYIVRISDPSVRETLEQQFEKVGKPRAIKKTILIETDKPKSEIEKIPGVVKVQEDVEIEFGEYEEHEVDNWALPRICGDYLDPCAYNEGHGKYLYNRTGKNVDVYIADTGISLSHDDLKDENGSSRVKTIYPDSEKFPDDRQGDDYGSRHGTSVASCTGGKDCGVAKEVNLFNVWVLYSGASTIKGLDRVLEHHLNKDNKKPSILNMSFGAKSETYLEDETKDLVESGVICIACAHNYDEPISTAPAIHSHVLSVGSADWGNKITRHSNYGDTVDFLAPGEHVKVARPSSDDSFALKASGTSYASPYTAGILALIVQDSIIENEKDVNKAIDILYEYSRKDFIQLDLTDMYGNDKSDTPNMFSFSLVENDPIKLRKYEVTTEIIGNGSIEPNQTNVTKDEKVEFKIIPDEGYKIKTIQGDGTMSDNTFTTDPITEDTHLIFEFEKIKHKVTVEIKGQGTVTPMEIEVAHGETVELEYEASDGYKLKEVKNG